MFGNLTMAIVSAIQSNEGWVLIFMLAAFACAMIAESKAGGTK